MLLMYDLIIHLGEMEEAISGWRRTFATDPVLWKLAPLVMRCGRMCEKNVRICINIKRTAVGQAVHRWHRVGFRHRCQAHLCRDCESKQSALHVGALGTTDYVGSLECSR